MAKHTEQEQEIAASGNGGAADGKAAEGSISPSKAASVFLKLKLMAGYAMRGSPVLAVLALVIAVIAVMGNLSTQTQLSMASAEVGSLNASLLATKGELEELKLAMLKNKAALEGEHKKHEELDAEIIRNITNLQIKFKIYPSLEEQLVQHPGSTAAAPVSPATSGLEHR
jgi:hypothetical protein